MANITPDPGSNETRDDNPGLFGTIAAVREEAAASGYAQRNASLADLRAAVHAGRRQALQCQPSRRRPRATTEAVNAAFDDWNTGAEQGPAGLEQRRREAAEQRRDRRDAIRRKTERRAGLYLRVHRHKLRLSAGFSHEVPPIPRSRERRGGARPSARRGPARSRAPSGDSDSSEPGPGWPGDEQFPEPPDRLQEGFYNAIRVGHATWMPRDAAGVDTRNRDRRLRFGQEGGVS